MAHAQSSPTASGGLTASTSCVIGSFGQCTYPPANIVSVTASGSTITLADDGGHTGTITLSGFTASGGLTASTSCVVGSFGQCTYPPAYIVSFNASGSSITLTDDGGHTGTISLSGALASGGLTASTSCVIGSFGQCTYPPAYIVSINASGASITIDDDGGHTGTTTLSP
jgi:flagellar basal body rod protein FlgF